MNKKQRIRDPRRREKIVEAAARLIALDGYPTVSIADIGAEAGIVGSGIYRHFESKAAVLVAIFDQVIDGLLEGLHHAISDEPDPEVALATLIDGQIEFVVGTRAIAAVYYREIKSLPVEARRRLRRKQRLYLEGWLPLVGELRPDLSEAAVRTLVHAAMGVIHSALNYEPELREDELRQLLAHGVRRVFATD